MEKSTRRPLGLARMLAWALFVVVIFTAAAHADTAGYVEQPDAEKPSFFWQIVKNLFNSRGLLDTLKQPEFTLAAFIALNLIVFVETGLLIGFFLPGDSLLVTAGVVCSIADWNLALLISTLSLSAIVGDSLGYSIGYKAGPKIFNREKSWLFKKDHLLKAKEFYDKHGGKTIVIARFMPIIRTFAPVVAGVGRMDYRRFLFFNIFGGIGWVVSMVLVGYFLTSLINPMFARLTGNPAFDVKDHIEKVVIVVVFLSILPGLIVWVKSKFFTRKSELPLAA